MASTKISGMPAATTPLDGTELVPIVQGGANKKATAAAVAAATAAGANDGEIPYVDTDILVYSANLKWDEATKTLTLAGGRVVGGGIGGLNLASDGTGLTQVTLDPAGGLTVFIVSGNGLSIAPTNFA